MIGNVVMLKMFIFAFENVKYIICDTPTAHSGSMIYTLQNLATHIP